jgi:uncharacterized membrane protein
MKRLPSIDIARGLVMVIMALDHTRDYLYRHADQSPTDLKTTTPVLFFTRWITHLCAPSFVFLSGASAWLYLYNTTAGTTASAADALGAKRRFLWQRGLVLILVEFTLVNFALSFDTHFRLFLFEVIATIGSGLFLLSFLSRLNPRIILAIAILLFAGHDIVDYVPMPKSPVLGFIGSLLFLPGGFPLGSRLLVIAYPILPWLGIMLMGFCAGRVFTRPAETQRKFLFRTGFAAIGLFILLRFVNVYGEPAHWALQKNGIYTFLSFMNVSKYPPSLLFSLATLGVLLLILAIAAGNAAGNTAAPRGAVSRILLIYGRVPLFYFVVHFYLVHLIMLVMVVCQGYPWSMMDFSPFKFGRPAGAGLPLGAVYIAWAAVVIVIYPICRWYGRYKATHQEKKWLRYL